MSSLNPELDDLKNFSPLDKIKGLFSGTPGTEAVLGLIMPPEISLFESQAYDTASIVNARRDHDRMSESFQEHGIQVYAMRNIIADVLAEKNQSRFETPEQLLVELKRRAAALYETYHMGHLDQVYQELEVLLRQDVQLMGADSAVSINAVLANCIDVTGKEKPFDLNQPPAANFMFWRDTNHVLGGNRVATHRMFYDIREQEVALAHLGFEALGLKYQPVIPGEMPESDTRHSIEGGDVETMELNGSRYALVGQAERTSWSAVQAWYRLHRDLFTNSGEGLIPAVVQGPHENTQDMMHLDTFVQQVAPGVIIHCREITEARQFSVLTERNGEILKIDEESFANWIDRQTTDNFSMSRDAQKLHAANVLTDAGQTVYITRDGTPEVTEFIAKHVPEVVLLGMNYLTNLYGGAHCSTSEFRETK